LFGTPLQYTEPVHKDPLVRPVNPDSTRLQLSRRGCAQLAQHPFWREAESRLRDRFVYIREQQGPRLEHGIAQYGQPIQLAPRSIQLVWSVGLLAYLAQPRATLEFWAGLLRPSGLMMFVTLGPDSLRQFALDLGDADQLKHVPGHPDMHDIGDALVGLGLADPVMDVEWIEFTYTSPELALTDIRTLGGNPLLARPAGLSGRGWRDRVLQALESQRRGGSIRLRIELVFGHAWSPDPNTRTGKPDPAAPQPVVWAPRGRKDP